MERATNIRAKSTAMSLVLSPTQNSEVKSWRMICAPRQNQSSSSYLDPGPSDPGGRGDNSDGSLNLGSSDDETQMYTRVKKGTQRKGRVSPFKKLRIRVGF